MTKWQAIKYVARHGHPLDEINVALADMDEWQSFVDANRDAILEQYVSVDAALKHACDGGLVLGGGASPLVHVYFAD